MLRMGFNEKERNNDYSSYNWKQKRRFFFFKTQTE